MKKLLATLLAVGFVFVLSAPASAADDVGAWSLYGTARVGTWYTSANDNAGGDKGLAFDLMNTQLGATVKKGAIGGGYEFGIPSDGNAITTRQLFGTVDFGGAQLLVGQTYTPVNMFYSNQVYGGDYDMLNVGAVFNNRHPMIQLSAGGFKIALVKQAVNAGFAPYLDIDQKIPKIEAAYHFQSGAFFADVMGGYQTYQIEDTVTKKDLNVNSYVGAIGVGVNMGPAYIRAGGYAGRNTAEYGLWQSGVANAVYDAATDSIKNAKTIGGIGVIGFKASDMLTIEAGIGYLSHDSDRTDIVVVEKDETMVYYGNCVIKVVPGLMLVPEVGVFDYKKSLTGVDEGSMWYAGLKTQVDF